MIVKNEADVILRCIQSIESVADEFVVVDTGSEDDTVGRLRTHGIEVIRSQWYDDFSYSRNISIEHARSDWILWLDADDVVAPDALEKIDALKRTPAQCVYGFVVRNERGGDTGSEFLQARMFPRHPQLRFERRIHEQILPSARRLGMRMEPHHEVVICHKGYADPATVRKKARRNVDMLLTEYENTGPDPVMALEIADSYKMLGENDAAVQWYSTVLSIPGAAHAWPQIVSSAHLGLGTALNQQHRFREAIEAFTKACEYIPDRPDALYGLAVAHEMCGEYVVAAAYLTRIPSVTPRAYNVSIDYRESALKSFLRLERVNARLDRDEETWPFLEQAKTRFGNRPELQNMRARLLFRRGKLVDSLHCFEESLNTASHGNIDAFLGLCAIYIKAGRVEDAQKTVDNISHGFTDIPRYHAFRELMNEHNEMQPPASRVAREDIDAEKELLRDVYKLI